MNKKLIGKLFSNMCCSECKSDFTQDAIKVMRKEEDLFVIQITCPNCGKSFGTAFFGQCSMKAKKHKDADLTLEIQEGPPPIGLDDVLDAHNFIQNMEQDWQKFIPENLRKH